MIGENLGFETMISMPGSKERSEIMSLPFIILGIGAIWAIIHLIKGMIKLAVLVVIVAVIASLLTGASGGLAGVLHLLGQ